MRTLISRLTFTRSLMVILLGNISCMVFSNLFRVPVKAVLILYPAGIFGGWLLVRRARFRSPEVRVSRIMIVAVLFVAAGITVMRVHYPLEWIPGNTIHVLLDDYARIAELVSMTTSSHYPLVSPVKRDFLFSFYYAALYPMAFLKLLVPVLTLKDVIFLGCMGYNFLVLLSLLEISASVLRSSLSVWVFQFFILAFSGLDWAIDIMLNGARFFAEHEWWQKGIPFHTNAQITAFPTALLFTVHHVAAGMSCLLAWLVLWRSRFTNREVKLLVVGLLLVNAFYSSVFVTLGCVPFLLVDKVLIRRMVRSPVFPLLFVMWLVPLSLFLNKLPGQHFVPSTARLGISSNFWIDKVLSFPVWLIAVSVVELAGVPLLLVSSWKGLGKKHRAYFGAAFTFLLSTYVIAYTGSNNYSMRGLLVPSLVMFLLFASRFNEGLPQFVSRFQSAGVVALILAGMLFSFGNVLEFTGHAHRSLLSTEMWWRITEGEEVARERFPVDYRGIARDHTIKVYEPRPNEYSRVYFNAEKPVDISLSRMDRWERELVRYPQSGWFN